MADLGDHQPAIVIPAYNAAATLPAVIERIPGSFWAVGGFVVVVDDASLDETRVVADDVATSRPGVYVVNHKANKGYGGALKTGLKFAMARGATVAAIVHADGQYAPEKVMEVLEPVFRREACIVQGSRLKGGGAREGGMPLTRYIPNRVLTTIENVAFGTRMEELHSGYMVYSSELLEAVPFERLQNNYNFDAEMILTAHLAGMRCAEVPIPTRYDDETSSLSPIPYGLNVLKMVGQHLLGHYRRLLRDHRSAQSEKAASQ